MINGNYNILFWPDINYEPGHWRPVMSIANKLKDKAGTTCSVKFLCTPECKPIIENVLMPNKSRLFGVGEVATILEDLFPVGYSTLATEKPEEARSRIDHCLKIAEGELDDVLVESAPDLLIAGFFVSMEALIIQYRYNSVLRSKVAEKHDVLLDNVPELKIMITTTYLRHPSEDPAITSLRFLTHHSQEQSLRLMEAAKPLTEGDNYPDTFSRILDFISPLETVTELITCPKILDHKEFKHPKEDKYVHYVEPCILDIQGSNPDRDTNLIYASAGSRVRDYVESAKTMFRVLKEMIDEGGPARERTLNMAVGYSLKAEFDREKFANPPKIKILEWADQTTSLKKAKSAVIHGGLASIKECIHFGTPIIVIPMGKDQMDNALRVANKEVGAIVMLGSLTPASLNKAILEVERNADIQENLEKMRAVFEEEETKAKSITLIKKELGIEDPE
jgi:hypothetical protein